VDGRFGSAAPPATGEIHQANQASESSLGRSYIAEFLEESGEDRSAQAEVGGIISQPSWFAALVKHNDFYRV